jgi:hypothetical protein
LQQMPIGASFPRLDCKTGVQHNRESEATLFCPFDCPC